MQVGVGVCKGEGEEETGRKCVSNNVMRCSINEDASGINVCLNGMVMKEVRCFLDMGSEVENTVLVEIELK